MTKNRDPNLKKIDTKIKKIFRRSRRAKRAGIPDAVLSSGARSAPELRPASGSRGLASDPHNIRKCQPLKNGAGKFKKTSPAPGWLVLNQRQECNVEIGNFEESFTFLTNKDRKWVSDKLQSYRFVCRNPSGHPESIFQVQELQTRPE